MARLILSDRPTAAVAGLLCVLAGVAVASAAAVWSLPGEFLLRKLLLCSAAVYAVGMAIYMVRQPRFPSWRSLLRLNAKLLASALVVEIMLNAAIGLAGIDRAELDSRASLSPYADKPWAGDYFREFARTRFGFRQFVMWRRQPLNGEYINIDADGYRRTWRPPAAADGRPDTVLVFGGSAAWGTGARDDYTIPSHVSRLLADGGRPANVVNCGESAYSFDQEVVQLVTLLQEGVRPRLVVFYDGVNDVSNAFQDGRAETVNQHGTIRAMADVGGGAMLREGAYRFLRDRSQIFRAFRDFHRLARSRSSAVYNLSAHAVGDGYDLARIDSLGARVADHYAAIHATLAGLARGFGFDYLCLWQPSIFLDETLTEEERGYPANAQEKLRRLHRVTRRKLLEKRLYGFHDVSDALGGRGETAFIDHCHLSEYGNRLVAERIVELLGPAARR